MNPKETQTTALTMGAGPVADRNERFKWPGQDEWKTSVYCCPVCNEPLRYRIKENKLALVIWCAYGPCRSKAANDGAQARTEQQAMDVLRENVEKEEGGGEC